MRRLAIVIVTLLLCTSPVMAVSAPNFLVTNTDGDHSNGEGRVIISFKGVKFEVSFNQSTRVISTTAYNPTRRTVSTGALIEVDERRLNKSSFDISPGETWSKTWNVTRGFHVHNDKHKITFATFENATDFYVMYPINSTNSPGIPSPRITNVRIANGTIDGSPSAVAYVTVENPSNQLYGASLLVHTTGTDGSYYTATAGPHGKHTIKVELLDERGSVIKGEARLYDENMSDESTAYDQVGFVGQAGKNTSVWNESYEPGMPPWASDPYTYENESDHQSLAMQASGGQSLYGVPLAYLGGGLVVVGLVKRLL